MGEHTADRGQVRAGRVTHGAHAERGGNMHTRGLGQRQSRECWRLVSKENQKPVESVYNARKSR